MVWLIGYCDFVHQQYMQLSIAELSRSLITWVNAIRLLMSMCSIFLRKAKQLAAEYDLIKKYYNFCTN